jgi:putative ABC transport system permease protein
MSWLERFRVRRSAERDLAEEMHQHLEEKIQELVGRGIPLEDASAQARREFGDIALLQEQSRDVWRSALFGDLLSDVRYTCRFLRRSKMFAAASIVTIAVAIAANAAVFTIVNAILLRPLPFPESDRLVSVQSRDIRGTPHPSSLSYPTFFDFRRANRVFEHIVCYRDAAFTLTDPNPAIQVPGEIVSWDFLSVLRVAPALGRGFLPIEEQPGTRAVVLSHELWSTYFGADESLVGRTISIDREPYTVVGIAAAGFRFPVGRRPKLWITLARDAVAASGQPVTEQRGARLLDTTGRLKPDVSIAAAQAEMDSVAGAIAAEHPDQNRNIATTYVRPELERIAGPTRLPLMILLGAVGLVLLIVCANIANLMLVRVMDRARELAMRLAIGASRMRLIRQVLTENLVIALAGSAVGIVLAAAAIRVAVPLWPEGVPRVEEITIDSRVVAFCVGLSLFIAVVVTLPTVLRLARADVSYSLKTGTWGHAGSHDTVRSSLLVAQVALGLMLLSSATLLLEDFLHLVRRDLGFRPDHLVTFSVSLSRSAYDDSRQEIFLQQLLERIRHAPGVAAAAAGSPLPLSGHGMPMSFGIQYRSIAPSDRPYADMAIVTPGFFRAIGARLEEGRDFAESDHEDAPPVLIVNRAFADRFFPRERAIGKRIEPGATVKNQGSLMREIVGIVGDARQLPVGVDREPIYYFPYRQLPWFPPAIVVRTVLAPEMLQPTLRGMVAELDRQVATADMQTMDERLAEGVAVPRFLTQLLSTFAAIALILTAIGLYGVTAYAVSKQTREIGIRIALGATRRSVTAGVMRRAALFVGIGVLVGLAGSVAGGRLLGSLMPGVPMHNVRVLGLACAILVLTAATAAFFPARRAASIDPLIALRAE